MLLVPCLWILQLQVLPRVVSKGFASWDSFGEGFTGLANLCKGSFVAERPRITGLMRIVTDMLSSLIPINVVAFPQIFKILRIASFDAVYF
jgi:hypothetical protein